MKYKGFTLREYDDVEDDNIKTWHEVSFGEGEGYPAVTFLDHTPYQSIDRSTFELYVEFYIREGRFPERSDIDSCGPLHKKDLVALGFILLARDVEKARA